MNVAFCRLSEVNESDLMTLMNHPRVRQHMPLASSAFDQAACRAFVTDKEKMWATHGYGPWAFMLNDQLIGWGGLQPEHGDADLGLVLHPDFWGLGMGLCRRMITWAFQTKGLESITVLLPNSRTRVRAMTRMGFNLDGEVEIDGHLFHRYRLLANQHP